MNKYFLSISILLLSIAIFYFAFQMGENGVVATDSEEPVQNIEIRDKGLLTSEEVAAYLSMDIGQFHNLIRNQNTERATYTIYDTYKFIPYIQINGKKYFSREQVDEWIKYNMTNWTNNRN